MSKYRIFSGLYFPAFGLNTERYGVFSPYARKYGPEKTPYLDTFHAVMKNLIFMISLISPALCLYVHLFFSSHLLLVCGTWFNFRSKFRGRFLFKKTQEIIFRHTHTAITFDYYTIHVLFQVIYGLF